MNINFIIALICFVITTIVFYVLNMRKVNILLEKKPKKQKSRKKDKKTIIIEFKFLYLMKDIKEEYLLNKKMVLITSLINSFIISVTFLVIMLLPMHLIFQLLIGFGLLIALIYSIYSIFGSILAMKGYDK